MASVSPREPDLIDCRGLMLMTCGVIRHRTQLRNPFRYGETRGSTPTVSKSISSTAPRVFTSIVTSVATDSGITSS